MGAEDQSPDRTRAASALNSGLSIPPAPDLLFLNWEKTLFQIQVRCLLLQKAEKDENIKIHKRDL